MKSFVVVFLVIASATCATTDWVEPCSTERLSELGKYKPKPSLCYEGSQNHVTTDMIVARLEEDTFNFDAGAHRIRMNSLMMVRRDGLYSGSELEVRFFDQDQALLNGKLVEPGDVISLAGDVVLCRRVKDLVLSQLERSGAMLVTSPHREKREQKGS